MSVEGFAAVPNWLIRDKKVSVFAVTVYMALASHSGPGGIFPRQTVLAEEARCSERKVRDALKELEGLGVVVRVKRATRAGRMSDGYELRPNGHIQQPAQHAGGLQQPAPGAAATGTSEQLVPLIEEEPLKKNPSLISPRSDELFEAAWKHWPRKENKKKAREKFGRLNNQAEVAAAIVEHGQAHAKYSGVYVPHLISWLNGARWEEPVPGPRAPSGGRSTVDIGRESHEILRERAAERERQAVAR